MPEAAKKTLSKAEELRLDEIAKALHATEVSDVKVAFVRGKLHSEAQEIYDGKREYADWFERQGFEYEIRMAYNYIAINRDFGADFEKNAAIIAAFQVSALILLAHGSVEDGAEAKMRALIYSKLFSDVEAGRLKVVSGKKVAEEISRHKALSAARGATTSTVPDAAADAGVRGATEVESEIPDTSPDAASSSVPRPTGLPRRVATLSSLLATYRKLAGRDGKLGTDEQVYELLCRDICAANNLEDCQEALGRPADVKTHQELADLYGCFDVTDAGEVALDLSLFSGSYFASSR